MHHQATSSFDPYACTSQSSKWSTRLSWKLRCKPDLHVRPSSPSIVRKNVSILSSTYRYRSGERHPPRSDPHNTAITDHHDYNNPGVWQSCEGGLPDVKLPYPPTYHNAPTRKKRRDRGSALTLVRNRTAILCLLLATTGQPQGAILSPYWWSSEVRNFPGQWIVCTDGGGPASGISFTRKFELCISHLNNIVLFSPSARLEE
ncbi:hypothetical protein BDW02DRAFT_569987 [Decorospora gaudefroyi]|uniref:Uncharacterized protein n=1 Tax=Decorospora gaudefroyi TaxID=184978 RepID=A0A6A5K6Z3_9PLEO|nr:hypothetical protein BDW02DRAFT_569987 [Decorospora gaudefroyi]